MAPHLLSASLPGALLAPLQPNKLLPPHALPSPKASVSSRSYSRRSLGAVRGAVGAAAPIVAPRLLPSPFRVPGLRLAAPCSGARAQPRRGGARCSASTSSTPAPSSGAAGPVGARGPAPVAAAVIEAEFVGQQGGEREERAPEEPQTNLEKGKKKFVWQQAWYPVGVAEDFNKKVPAAVTILGLPLVVWWDQAWGAGGGWRVFHDLCPHRLAPLSEGRIHESGDLQCSYHGWTFQGDGACSRIPQQDPDRPQASTSKKACARAYPAREHQGILWVWPELEAEGGGALADATPIPTVPQQSDPTYSVSTGQCDLGYSYEFLVENLADPAHVPFAHHKIMGNRKNAAPLDFVVDRIALDGITGGGTRFRSVTFHPPTLIHTVIVFPSKDAARDAVKGNAGAAPNPNAVESAEPVKDRQLSMAFYCVPKSPGHCRVIFAFSFNFLPPVAKLIPRWYSHIGQMLVLDSDHYFLHLLERRLQDEGGQKKALGAYYTPTKSDAFVVAFRKWLAEFADSTVQYPETMDLKLPPEPTKRELMDRQRNHVKMCQSCQRAQGWMEKLQVVLKVVAFAVLAITAGMTALRPTWFRPTLAVGLLLCSGASAAASAWLSRFISTTYYFLDYIHALVD